MTGRMRRLAAGTVYPLIVLLAGLALSAAGAYYERRQIEKNAQDEFERMAVRTEQEIAGRMERVVYALRAASGLYAASERVQRHEFRNFILSRNMEVEFPGVRGFGFIQRVERADLAAFVAAEQADGAPGFAIRQLVDKAQSDLFVIKLIEPAANNQGALGLDVGSEALRRAGLRQAVNTGAATVTAAITLVQDKKQQPGVLLYLPVYRKDAPAENPVERNAALAGVLYAPIVMAEILDGMPDVKSGLLDFEILDAPINSSGGAVMFVADNHISQLAAAEDRAAGGRFSLRKPLQLPGRSVTLSMRSSPVFDASVNAALPYLLLAGGALVSALLALMLRQQASGRLHAERLARGMTQDLQKAVRDNQALLSTLHSHAIVSVTDSGGRIVEVNDAFCSTSGYSRAELIGQDHRIVNAGLHAKAFWVAMWETIASGSPWRGQVCNMARDGKLYWTDTMVAPFFGTDGAIEKYISIRTDISASKKSEEALRWSQSLLDKMAKASPLGFLVVDNRSDEILYFNQRFCEIWGITHLAERMHRKELKNNDVIADCLPALADVQAFAQSCYPLQSESNRITLEDEIAFTGDRTVRRFTTQIRDADDQYFGRFFIFEDVTERKRTEAALIQATEAAQAASVSKSQFLANMSHEIRTPMNAILGMLTLLRKTELTARQADYAAKSDGAARALLGLLNEILDFSKIESGKMTLDPHPFSVDQMLRDLSVILSSNVGQKPVEVLFDIDPLLPRQLVGDAMRLQQILLNLGSNAIKFTEQGEVVLSVQVMQHTHDAVTLQFSMRDSGIGIAPENQARIFSGFTQAESSTTRRFGGTGLGVVISQRFVTMMGGELALQSELGRGSCFYFTVTLPIAAAQDTDAQARKRAPADSGWRALVIDDNRTARAVLEHMGQSLGWQVDLAESGAEALQMLEQRQAQGIHYQAIFVDWGMPGMDGWQTSQHIRNLQAGQLRAGDTTAAAVVVMVTAHGREMLSHRSPAEQALLDGFLVKPITASMLFDAVIDARSGHEQPHPSHAAAPARAHRLEGMRLLLVEDNLNNQQVARELLEDEGARVQIANHGQEAVEAIAAATATSAALGAAAMAFDVVLMDLQMPVMDGFAATRAIRHDLGLDTLPIVAMTANAMASDREACLAAGMNDHVGKPFDINDLVRVLRGQARWGDALAEAVPPASALASGVAQAAAAGGLDIAAALNRLGGKQDVYRRMLQTFVSDLQALPAQLRALAQACAPGAAPEEAKRALHTLKGLSATLGATALSAEAARAEKAMAAGPAAEQAMAITTQACEAIAAALPDLQALLQALQQAHADQVAATAGHAQPTGDRSALQAALQALLPLLQADDMDAMNAFADVQQQFGDVLDEDMTTLEAAMADLEFDAALPLCKALLQRYAA